MKLTLLILSSALLITACNNGPKAPVSIRSVDDSLRFATDTSGLAEYQAWKAQNELGETSEATAQNKSGTEKKKSATAKTPSSTGEGSDAMNTESGNSAKAKKGWSKTAKGAVIGGVVGAGTGAVVNKKNRVAGAVIGGAIGAGAGAIIGNEMDKKDGRH